MECLFTRLGRKLFFLILVVAMVPSLILGMTVYYHCKKIAEQEYQEQLVWQMRHTQKTVDYFLEEHLAALHLLFSSHTIEEFNDQNKLQHIFSNFKQEFPDFVDLGLIDSTGRQKTYNGPYKLLNSNYRDEQWFQDILVRGSYISDVFLGKRQIPHVVLAIESPTSDRGEVWILWATINAEAFDKIVGAMNRGLEDDTLIVNKKNFLQNTSRFHGDILTNHHYLPPYKAVQEIIVTEGKNARNEKALIAYTSLRNKDWTLGFVQPFSERQKRFYPVQRSMAGLLIGCFIVVFQLAGWITRNFVDRLKEAEQEQEALLRGVEHTNKLASIGRLAAGVAHEINNPLAIINEKAGLMKDLTELSDDFDNKEKFEDLLRSINSSVTRCRAITHRLLGFARRMDVTAEVIDINALIQEVLGFLDKEALYRDVHISLDLTEDLPTIESDRGQLQQVFLNFINNAMDATTNDEDESYQAEIIICTWQKDEETVAVKICDNGCGIPPDKLKRIFEPFFTTKARGKGTGLGLSITYGIIDKLGGKISVESEVNQGTAFTIELPLTSNV
jgi:two-component system NtrC family sensor kinase